jgi:hypothetical protein
MRKSHEDSQDLLSSRTYEVSRLKSEAEARVKLSTSTVEDYRKQIDQLRRERDTALASSRKDKTRAEEAVKIATKFLESEKKLLRNLNLETKEGEQRPPNAVPDYTLASQNMSNNETTPFGLSTSLPLPEKLGSSSSLLISQVGLDTTLSALNSWNLEAITEAIKKKEEKISKELKRWQKECKFYKATAGNRIAVNKYVLDFDSLAASFVEMSPNVAL